jgi:undecaprenyl diphosphate synthase
VSSPAATAETRLAGVPRHVAIIMDGNGRWAKARGLPARPAQAGRGSCSKGAPAAGEAGVECLTLYAFSSENWRRPETEINDLMGLLSSTSAPSWMPSIAKAYAQDHRRSHCVPTDIVKMIEKASQRRHLTVG